MKDMRVLWLSMNDGLLCHLDGTGYHGIGWISSLQSLVEQTDVTLALAYVSKSDQDVRTVGRTEYYPIYQKPRNRFQKLREYYGGYRHIDRERYVPQIQAVIGQFRPDVIHLFGIDSDFATILGRTDLPVIVHYQGILGPISNTFFPSGISKLSFLFPPTIREWLLRNGTRYAYDIMRVRSRQEEQLFKSARYFMGRTRWDEEISKLLSPDSIYYTVNEVLRPAFYEHAGEWHHFDGEFTIVSTLSETTYKGLDLVLKTADLMHRQLDMPFRWKVVGITPDSKFVRHFERALDITGSAVGVTYEGIKSEPDLVTELLNSHVYVHTSYIENSSNSICEAQLLGVPVVATRVGGTDSLIEDGKSGLLIPANGVYELAVRLKRLASDTAMTETIGKTGYEIALERHNPTKITDALMDTYRNVLMRSE